MSNTVQCDESDLFERACAAYGRRCRRDGSLYQQPSGILSEVVEIKRQRYVVLFNGFCDSLKDALAVYRVREDGGLRFVSDDDWRVLAAGQRRAAK